MDLVKEQLPELPERNIIVEPEGRNTAPCIAFSAFDYKKYIKMPQWQYYHQIILIKDEENLEILY